ncbi:MAG: amidohydrolase [Spirochaetes bacterium]|nr:amidohydrolase [Spirochaetota bacterium]
MEIVKDLEIIDVCVIPPLQETIDGFANPSGPFSKYNELYSNEQKSSIIEIIRKEPEKFLLKLMDDSGVSRVLLTAEDAETTMGLKVPNTKVAQFVQRNPERFLFMGAVDPYKGMNALKELEFAVKELNMKCLCLEPWLHKIKSNDKLYYPIYAKCVELDIPIWIHTSLNFVPSLTMDYGRPLYLDEVAGHFPELKIIAGHGGWPWVNEMIAVMWRHKNVYTDIAAIRPKYIATTGSGWDMLLQYGNTILQDKVLFATAWPARDFKESIEEILSLPLKDKVKEKWLGKNAKKILNI